MIGIAVGIFGHKKIITDQQGRDHRAGWNIEWLKQKGAHDQGDQQRLEDNLQGIALAALFRALLHSGALPIQSRWLCHLIFLSKQMFFSGRPFTPKSALIMLANAGIGQDAVRRQEGRSLIMPAKPGIVAAFTRRRGAAAVHRAPAAIAIASMITCAWAKGYSSVKVRWINTK